MAFNTNGGGSFYTPSGAGWYLAKSLQTLADEITAVFPTAVCLGTKGDTTHAGEGYQSDHNPFIVAPDGQGVVRAIDVGGPLDVQHAVRDHLYALAAAHDPRLYPFGFLHIDGRGTPWPIGDRGWTYQPGDVGHLHVSVTQRNGNNPSPAGYVPDIDSTAPWGFMEEGFMAQLTDAQQLQMYNWLASLADSSANTGIDKGGTLLQLVRGLPAVVAANKATVDFDPADEAELANAISASLTASLPAAVIAALKEAL